MSVANDSSGTPSKILIDKDLQSTAQEKEAADEVPSQFKSPAEIRGYSKAIQTRGSRKLNGTSSSSSSSSTSSSGRLIQIIDKLERLLDPNVVSPRKRILRELERVSLDDQASKRHQYGTRKRRQQGSSKILTDSPEKKNLVEKKKKQEEKENKIRKRKPKKRRKRSKFWNYFNDLKPSLAKCTTCKKEIKISRPSNRIAIFRTHLKKHGIFLDNDIHTLSDELKQYYSEFPGYKAKCNNCGETVSFLNNIANLRRHLKIHSTIIQSRDEMITITSKKRRSKFWNYFKDLKPLLLKCRTCKKEIKVSNLGNRITIMRVHLFKKHGISLDDDTLTLPDDLKQYYSELPGYKAKCNNCGETVSFLTHHIGDLRKHLRRHSTKILSRDEPSTSSLADNSVDPSADRQSQDTSDLFIQSFKEAAEKTGALDKPSTLSSTADIMDPSTGKCIPLPQSQAQVPSGLPVQSFKETAENTGVLDEPSTSSSADYVMDPSAEHQSGEPSDLPVQSFGQMTEGTSALHSDWFYYTIPSASRSTCYVMAPSAEHQSGEQPDLPVQLFEQMTEGTSALYSDWFYCTMPSASSSTCYVMAPSAEHQSGEQPDLPVQSFEQMTEGTSTVYSNQALQL
ncbi:uncharacterized protein [Temnothorax longispinosus]|uniref:uncharacterized protein isoform X2 n=1 Tax=Temnothorax longispinosus TaxID=300112 RepID=UPI003A995FCB